MRFFLRCVALIVLSYFWFLGPSFVRAQETGSTGQNVEIGQPLTETATVSITGTAQLPNTSKATTFNGRGEPGAQIVLTVLAGSTQLFTQTTNVDNSGRWQVIIPPLTTTPTNILITSEVEATFGKVFETTTVTTLVGVSTLIVFQLITERLLQFFQVAGLFGRKKTRGFVYDVETKKPVPFAELTIESVANMASKKADKLIETVVSSVDGFFRTVDLPAGQYVLKVGHSGFTFPVTIPKPWYASPLQFYQGEPIELSSQQMLEIVFIPLQPREAGKESQRYWLNARIMTSVLLQLAKSLTIPMGIISMVILVIYPSFVNFVIAAIYLVFALEWLIRYYSKRAIKGKVTDDKNQPIANAVVRIFRTNPENSGLAEGLVGVMLSNDSGDFKLRVTPGKYQIIVNKEGLVATENQGMSYEAVDVTQSVTNLKYHLVSIKKAAAAATTGASMQGAPMPLQT